MLAVATLFWLSLGLLIYSQAGYPLLLWVLARVPGGRDGTVLSRRSGGLPTVSLVIAAHNEEGVIAEKVGNALALNYPRELLEVVVTCDGCTDGTAGAARLAGADLVLELPRGGKVRAQDAAVARSRGELVAFSDANSFWQPDALASLVARFSDPKVGYVCGKVRFLSPEGNNQEGVYWRYELFLRALESRLASVTAGNGAIYATRRSSYIEVDPIMGHDLSFPFNMVKRGYRAVYEPSAVAVEKMVPTVEGEFARKRRMMSHAWPIVLKGGMLSPRGYSPLYALMIVSHRLLRYFAPFLHLVALTTNAVLLGEGAIYLATFVAQCSLLFAALLGRFLPARPLLVARYYTLTTFSLAAGLWDWLRHGTEAGWESPAGTR